MSKPDRRRRIPRSGLCHEALTRSHAAPSSVKPLASQSKGKKGGQGEGALYASLHKLNPLYLPPSHLPVSRNSICYFTYRYSYKYIFIYIWPLLKENVSISHWHKSTIISIQLSGKWCQCNLTGSAFVVYLSHLFRRIKKRSPEKALCICKTSASWMNACLLPFL